MARVLVQNVKVSWTQVEVPDKCPQCHSDLQEAGSVSRSDGRGEHGKGSIIPQGTGLDESDDFEPEEETWQWGGGDDFGAGAVWCTTCQHTLALGVEEEASFVATERAA